ncbi:MAG: Eco57I restriction-modification methylase domain-containing protein [Betaproteobacteria bacterium]|nr:Eco57I restriction-modification methylase domain-containing protein [Betaproteobacteria bacterium]
MTPPLVARFIAALFPPSAFSACRLLDAGAGMGALSAAFLERCGAGELGVDSVTVDAYELDPALAVPLRATLDSHGLSSRLPGRPKNDLAPLGGGSGGFPEPGERLTPHCTTQVLPGDFIEQAVTRLGLWGGPRYTHAVLNPPYKKIASHSRHRLLLRQAGIEASNLYAGFVALALALLEPGGQLVAIIPRSFCNGPYFQPFRHYLLEHAALRHIHLFAARDQAFRADGVLQENLILRLERGGVQGAVTLSTSTDDRFTDYQEHAHPFDHIVHPGDAERFIYIPTSSEPALHEGWAHLNHTLTDLGLEVSTGPVVDFRLRAWLRDQPQADTAPLLYPLHFRAGRCTWPLAESRKPNAIVVSPETRKWLYPNGHYCVTRRLSSKEEKRRIVASITDPAALPETVTELGFENHLNVFHQARQGLPPLLAQGLAAYLNSGIADAQFRRFNGHTQVNATDLRRLRYPSRDALLTLGAWAMEQGDHLLADVDAKLEALLACPPD